MNIFHSVLLGIVEGATEFLPVSSTAHLIITSKFLGLSQNEFQTLFEVVIQSGAILAVVFMYVSYLLKNRDALTKVIVSFIPTAIVGLLLHKIIKEVFFGSMGLIIASTIIVSLVFLIVEKMVRHNKLILSKSISQITYLQALLIGLAQSIAVVPGVSRAGIVIVFMILLGFKREESAKYSFLLAMPTILAASALDLVQSRSLLATSSNTMLLGVGFIVSFVTALFSVRWFISYLQRHTLSIFAYYRLVLAIILVLIFGI